MYLGIWGRPSHQGQVVRCGREKYVQFQPCIQAKRRRHLFDTNTGTMDYLGTLSPASSSVDSPLSPTQLLYNSNIVILDDVDIRDAMPFLEILEQPVEKFRFRYKSEMVGTHGSLTGITSDRMRKNTYPTVRLHNYNGHAVVRCSLFQIKENEPHAHRLVVRAGPGEKDDPHDIDVSPERDYTVTFQGMGIIHTAKKHLNSELFKKKIRLLKEELQRKGIFRKLTHKEEADIAQKCEEQSKTMNLNTVRLKFEAFRIEIIENQSILVHICPPIFSHGINNLKSALTGELKIVRMDHTTTSCLGGQEIFILVEKVTKNNIKVRFFEQDEDGIETWCDFGKFSHIDVHHQYAIVFKTPPYKDLNIENTVEVLIELVRPSDGARSEPRIFKYKPSEKIGRKRTRYSESLSSNELPATINNVSFGSTSISVDSLLMKDPDFFKNWSNVDSTEFDQIVDQALKPYEDLATDGLKQEPIKKIFVPRIDSQTELLARRVVSELTAFLKTNPSPERVETLVNTLFFTLNSNGNTALHTSILCEQFEHLQYILVLLSKIKHLKIADIKNNDGETALHLAIKINNPTVVNLLLPVGADANAVDSKGNTPLHLAIIDNRDLQGYKNLINETNLDIENDDGYTVLQLAVLKGNLISTKILVDSKANVNKSIGKNGNTALHIAIEEKHTNLVRYLLEQANARIDIENYNRSSPVHMAKMLAETEGEVSQKIFGIINSYIKENGFETLLIKTEPEEDDSGSDSDLVIKSEPVSPAEDLFDLDSTFSEYSIRVLGSILDGSPYLDRLIKDMEFENIASSMHTTTKMLLYYANTAGITPAEVRNYLREYGAREVVDVLTNSLCVKKL